MNAAITHGLAPEVTALLKKLGKEAVSSDDESGQRKSILWRSKALTRMLHGLDELAGFTADGALVPKKRRYAMRPQGSGTSKRPCVTDLPSVCYRQEWLSSLTAQNQKQIGVRHDIVELPDTTAKASMLSATATQVCDATCRPAVTYLVDIPTA